MLVFFQAQLLFKNIKIEFISCFDSNENISLSGCLSLLESIFMFNANYIEVSYFSHFFFFFQLIQFPLPLISFFLPLLNQCIYSYIVLDSNQIYHFRAVKKDKINVEENQNKENQKHAISCLILFFLVWNPVCKHHQMNTRCGN